MAETAVNFVLGRILDVLVKEVELKGEVRDQVGSVERELACIQCLLRYAESKRKLDDQARQWVNDVRNVAYQIEDAVDEYFVEMNYNHPRESTFRFSMKYFKLPASALRSLGSKIAKIQKVLHEISERKDRYQVCLDQVKEQEPKLHLRRRYAIEDIDETEVVGLQADKINVLNLLLDTNISRCAVISIVGPGGLGKTTLAEMVYKSAKAEFNYHLWLTISREFNLSDVLRNNPILSESEVQDEGHLVSKLKRLLSGKKYLIIMDDVWNENLWVQLRAALPDENNGSRVLMTSRFINVAKSADPTMIPYLLKFLNEKESLDLLLSKALPFQNTDEICSSDLVEVAKPLSEKCKGLPLALIVVGGILSTKDQSYPEWKRVLRTMDWHSDGKDCMDILAMSYEDMPHHRKAGFKYFASFPEDYEISAKHLILMWTAEGFIPRTASKTMEETAEDCLHELVQRCMVQVSSRSTDGSIKYCRIHDLLRDLAIHEAKEDNFITVFSKGRDVHQLNRATRRVSLQSCSSQLTKCISPNARSFHLFGELLPNFSEFRLLKVLQIEGVWQGIELMGLDGLINLKYLGFRNCKYVRIDPCSFGCLLNLETLDLRGTSMEPRNSLRNVGTTSMVPHSLLWKIGTLRHVKLSKPLSGPPSSAQLENLRTLRWVFVLNTWQVKLPILTNLQKLGLKNPSREWNNITKLLRTLPSLVSLGMKGDKIPLEIVDMRPLPSYGDLQSLYLEGEWLDTVTVKASLFPPRLIKLTLAGSKLSEDPLLELAKLKNLTKLRLLQLSYLGNKMTCPVGGFMLLQKLELSQLTRLEVWELMEKSMPKLNNLKICSCKKLRALPEVQNLTMLRELKLESMPHEFKIRTQEQDYHKISGIPYVMFS